MHIILWALFNLINVLIRQMLNKNKNSSFLKQVVVGGIGGAAGGMLLKYDMKTSVFIGVVAYVAYTNFFDSKGGVLVGQLVHIMSYIKINKLFYFLKCVNKFTILTNFYRQKVYESKSFANTPMLNSIKSLVVFALGSVSIT